MRKKILVICSLLLLSTIVLSTVEAIKEKRRAHSIRIDGIAWHKKKQAFVVNLSVKYGIANSSIRDRFKVRTSFAIRSDQGVFYATPAYGRYKIEPLPDAKKDEAGYVAVNPQWVYWDRANGAITGPVKISVKVSLINPMGRRLSATRVGGKVKVASQ